MCVLNERPVLYCASQDTNMASIFTIELHSISNGEEEEEGGLGEPTETETYGGGSRFLLGFSRQTPCGETRHTLQASLVNGEEPSSSGGADASLSCGPYHLQLGAPSTTAAAAPTDTATPSPSPSPSSLSSSSSVFIVTGLIGPFYANLLK